MASNEMVFEGTLPSDAIEGAELFLVAPSGGIRGIVILRSTVSALTGLMKSRLLS